MKSSNFPSASCVIIFLLLVLDFSDCLQLPPDLRVSSSGIRKNLRNAKEGGNEEIIGIYATGSSLPDCSHACGPCFPCRRVMVSFKCSIAESCPIVYRCMCRGRFYHTPSY